LELKSIIIIGLNQANVILSHSRSHLLLIINLWELVRNYSGTQDGILILNYKSFYTAYLELLTNKTQRSFSIQLDKL